MFVYCFKRVASSPEFQRLESVLQNLPVRVEFDVFGAVNQVKFGFMKAGIINTENRLCRSRSAPSSDSTPVGV